MRKIIFAVSGIAIFFIAYHLYCANAARLGLRSKLSDIKASVESIEKENIELEKDMEYFSDPHNLEKEARARFNYRAPNEKMIIVAPKDN